MLKEYIAPAKLNLSLRILSKRQDGFHALESLFLPITLGDTLLFEPAASFGLQCSDASLPVDADNLVWRAAHLFAQKANKVLRWRIFLQKNIPHGAGLGGGSSDAATTLLALNTLEGEPLRREELVAIAAQCGSDVPFFLAKSAAYVRGRGEYVEPCVLPFLENRAFLLLKPAFGVSTAKAYAHWDSALGSESVQAPWGEAVNSLERPVFAHYPFLAVLKAWMERQEEVELALMSGSGSTIFALGKEGSALEGVIARAQRECDSSLWGKVVRAWSA